MADEPDYNTIPSDFPRPAVSASVSGMQPKLALSEFQGQFYAEGTSPPEVWARWDGCEDLAKQMAAKSLESKSGKRAHMAEEEILAQYIPRLVATRWVNEPEARWVIRRAAAMLGWPVPAAALADA